MKATEERIGYAPYRWQIDICEAAYLGVDVLVAAGTGRGKTLPFVLSHFVVPKSLTVILSPLNALEYDQASIYHTMQWTRPAGLTYLGQVKRFRKMGLRACAVNGETFKKKKIRKVSNREFGNCKTEAH